VRESARSLLKILKINGPYRHFEIGFMAYGFAYMISNAVITIFFDRALHLNYSSVAFYKNGFNLLSILLLPFFGRLLGRIDPRKFGVITFFSMLLAILFIALSEYFSFSFEFHGIRILYLLILYVIFMGIYTATIQLVWYIGSAYFCPREEAGDYQSVHLILTGVRGAMAPTGGVILYKLVGFTFTFSIAIVLLAIAMLVMIWSYRREVKMAAGSGAPPAAG
jgi:MFS family permease